MKNGIELLRDISKTTPTDRTAMPQEMLRFMLEYRTKPNLPRERQRLQEPLASDFLSSFTCLVKNPLTPHL